MITTLADLTPATRRIVEDYLAEVAPTIDAEYRELVLCDLRAWLADHLDPDTTPDAAREIVARAGGMDAAPDEPAASDRRHGTFAGVPFDVRPPTAERLRRALWNPTDPRLFMPRTFGVGWDLNLGAAAVRLGLIEPDAEDVPFTHTPQDALRAAALVPAGLAAAVVAHYVVRGRSLPARLPSHWGADGVPDATITKGAAAALDVAASVLPAGVAGWALARRSKPDAAVLTALASGAAAVAATVTVVRSLPTRRRPWVPLAAPGALIAGTGGVLAGLALLGRRGEMRRDLGAAR